MAVGFLWRLSCCLRVGPAGGSRLVGKDDEEDEATKFRLCSRRRNDEVRWAEGGTRTFDVWHGSARKGSNLSVGCSPPSGKDRAKRNRGWDGGWRQDVRCAEGRRMRGHDWRSEAPLLFDTGCVRPCVPEKEGRAPVAGEGRGWEDRKARTGVERAAGDRPGGTGWPSFVPWSEGPFCGEGPAAGRASSVSAGTHVTDARRW